jgi:ABC-type branched-subunit amino acid transport system substrate-binding protein
VSSFYVGISGALLFTVYLGAVEVGEAYGIQKSFLVLFMIIIGGLGSLFGSFAGAAFMVLLPVLLKVLLVDTTGLGYGDRHAFPVRDRRLPDHVLPDRGAARAGASLGASEGETEIVALPALRGARWAGSPTLRTWSARGAKRRQPGTNRGERHRINQREENPDEETGNHGPGGRDGRKPGAGGPRVPVDLSYRTGPYAAGGIPFSDGYQDYFTLLNERDGGIGGVMTRVVECETAYNTERGVECYESTKGEGALVYQPLSTGITYQLIPRATADGIPLHTMGYGRTSAANGDVFSHVFNYPANYWDAASVIVNQLLEENDGSLEGKTIALLYHNSAYGREPIRTLETLAEMHGFELTQIAVDHPRPGAGQPVAADPPRASRLRRDVGLGRDEPGRRAGSHQHPLPDGELHRQLVGGCRA